MTQLSWDGSKQTLPLCMPVTCSSHWPQLNGVSGAHGSARMSGASDTVISFVTFLVYAAATLYRRGNTAVGFICSVGLPPGLN